MNIIAWWQTRWCDLFHGGGAVKRDEYERINWQCNKCGRWADPVDRYTERLVIEADIRKRIKEKNG